VGLMERRELPQRGLGQGPRKLARGSGGTLSSPSGVCGGAPAAEALSIVCMLNLIILKLFHTAVFRNFKRVIA